MKQTISELLREHIDLFMSDDMFKIINDLSKIINGDYMKVSLNIAQDLKILSTAIITEEARNIKEKLLMQHVDLSEQLNTCLALIQNQLLDDAQVLEFTIGIESVQKVGDVVTQLQTDLVAIISSLANLVMVGSVTHDSGIRNKSRVVQSIIHVSEDSRNNIQVLENEIKAQCANALEVVKKCDQAKKIVQIESQNLFDETVEYFVTRENYKTDVLSIEEATQCENFNNSNITPEYTEITLFEQVYITEETSVVLDLTPVVN